MFAQSLTVVRQWLPEHELSMDCWCRPLLVDDDGEWLWAHRPLPVLPDDQERCFLKTLDGAPV